MATSKELRDMADRLDWEADQHSAVLDGRFPAEMAGRLSGFRSGQSGQRPGNFIQACQRAWKITAVYPSKWQQKRQQRLRKWRRRVERRRRRRNRHAEGELASKETHDIGVPGKAKELLSGLAGTPNAGLRGRKLLSSPMLRVHQTRGRQEKITGSWFCEQ